jgi:hypothetical protein
MGLSFTIVAGPRQRTHSRIRVPWDSRPYFTVPDSRLSFFWPPTTRRATVEVFDPTSTLESFSICICISLRQSFANWIGNILSEGSVYPLSLKQLRCAGNVYLLCCENNCLSSRYNGNASVRCLGNDVSELSPLIRISGIPSQYISKYLKPFSFFFSYLKINISVIKVYNKTIAL